MCGPTSVASGIIDILIAILPVPLIYESVAETNPILQNSKNNCIIITDPHQVNSIVSRLKTYSA